MNVSVQRDTVCIRDVWDYFPDLVGDSLNFYYTPAHGQGLMEHADPYDLTIIQIFGQKYWKLPRQEFWLQAGDTFHLPRMTVHECWAGPEHSGHLALGVLQN